MAGLKLFLILTLFGAAPVSAQDDPFYEVVHLKSGPHKGKLLDTARSRSIQLMNEENVAKYFATEALKLDNVLKFTIANVQHVDGFYMASFDARDLESVILQLSDFKVPVIGTGVAAHSMIRFVFKTGAVKLKSQTTGVESSVSALTFSPESLRGLGESYKLWDGLFGKYAISYKFITDDLNREVRVIQAGETIRQYELALADDVERALLRTALYWSSQKQYRDIYNTWFKSCSTISLKVIDETMNYTHQGVCSDYLRRVTSRLPSIQNWFLKTRQIFSQKLPNF